MLVLNIFLAIAWAAVSGEMSVANLTAGFLIGYGVLWVTSRKANQARYFAKSGEVVRFCASFVWELLLATFRVAIDIVTPRHLMKPAILEIPVGATSAAETTMLANVITLTPGTLSLDVSPDGTRLYVHAMYAAKPETARQAIASGLGRRVREVFR